MRGMLDRPEQELILVVDDAVDARQRLGALLADRYQVSAERVRQLEKNAMKKLQQALQH